MTDQEQIAALQAVIAEARDRVRFINWGDMHAVGTLILSDLASAPSDVLDRVKREAAAQALDGLLIAETRQLLAHAWDKGFDAAVDAMHGDASHDEVPNPYREATK